MIPLELRGKIRAQEGKHNFPRKDLLIWVVGMDGREAVEAETRRCFPGHHVEEKLEEVYEEILLV
jgi:hypothetical protein